MSGWDISAATSKTPLPDKSKVFVLTPISMKYLATSI